MFAGLCNVPCPFCGHNAECEPVQPTFQEEVDGDLELFTYCDKCGRLIPDGE